MGEEKKKEISQIESYFSALRLTCQWCICQLPGCHISAAPGGNKAFGVRDPTGGNRRAD